MTEWNDSIYAILERRIEQLEQQNAALLEALKDWHDMFEWGGFTIDFSNGVTYQGMDEGDIKGNNMLHDMIEKTKQAIALAEGGSDG